MDQARKAGTRTEVQQQPDFVRSEPPVTSVDPLFFAFLQSKA